MGNIIVSIIILTILTIAILPLLSARKRGIKCMGCAHAKNSARDFDRFTTLQQPQWMLDYKRDKTIK